MKMKKIRTLSKNLIGIVGFSFGVLAGFFSEVDWAYIILYLTGFLFIFLAVNFDFTPVAPTPQEEIK